jgi:hypothetical protein
VDRERVSREITISQISIEEYVQTPTQEEQNATTSIIMILAGSQVGT